MKKYKKEIKKNYLNIKKFQCNVGVLHQAEHNSKKNERLNVYMNVCKCVCVCVCACKNFERKSKIKNET